ncbi:MAG: YfhO family protein [Lachnospiraceae bacterium]|nr:YfhO family protein [Lachnospiraceae bacterium]
MDLIKKLLKQSRTYIAAFIIPAVSVYVAYAIFGMYPFGEKSILVLDLNGQYIYYFEALRAAFLGSGSVFYDWSGNLSGGFMGTVGYYLASPFSLLAVILPEKNVELAVLLMQLGKLGCAGVTFNHYVRRSKKVSEASSLIFSTMYAMMAYGVIQLMNPMWLDSLVFLPLICLGVEMLVDDGNMKLYIPSLALMCISQFYIGYMICIFVALYFFYYIFAGSEKKFDINGGLKALMRMAFATSVAMCLAAFMLLPTVNALALGKFSFTADPDYSFRFQSTPNTERAADDMEAVRGWMSGSLSENLADKDIIVLLLDLVDLMPQLLPGQYDSVNVWGKPEIYCGFFTVLLLPFFFMNKEISLRKKIGVSVLIAAVIMSMLTVPVDMWWHGGQSPNWLPFRYSFLLSFIFLSMAAEAFSKRTGTDKKHFIVSIITVLILDVTVFAIGFEQMAERAGWIAADISVIYLILYFFLLYPGEGKAGELDSEKKQKWKKIKQLAAVFALLAASVAELTWNAHDTMKDVDDELDYAYYGTYQNFIQNSKAAAAVLKDYDDGFYRAEKTYFRFVNDNDAIRLRGVSHSSSVMNARILKYLEALGYDTKSYYSRYDGNTEISDSLLGIKYVMAKENGSAANIRCLNPSYEKLGLRYEYADHDGVSVSVNYYENKNALPIGYMASDDILRIKFLGNDNPFRSQNIYMSTLAGNTVFDEEGHLSDWNRYFYEITQDDEPYVASALTYSPYGEQMKYDVTGEGDPTIDFHYTVTDDAPVYLFIKTEFQHEVNLWTAAWTEDEWENCEWRYLADHPECETFNRHCADMQASADRRFKFNGAYFEGDNYIIVRLGEYEKGTRLTLRMTVAKDFVIYHNVLVAGYDRNLFEQDIKELSENVWELDTDKSTDRYLIGKVSAKEGKIMVTSIPYEPGWTVRVDGKKIKNVVRDDIDAETGKVKNASGAADLINMGAADYDECVCEAVNSLYAVKLTPGEHTVSFSYTPPGLVPGIILFLLGTVTYIILCLPEKHFWGQYLRRHKAKGAKTGK